MRVLMLPPTITVASLLLMLLLHTAIPLIRIIESPYRFLGMVFVFLGALMILLAATYFRRLHTTLHPFGETSCLATAGLYKLSRNPMYLGMLLMLVGVAVSLGTITPAFVLPFFVWLMTSRHIKKEEKKLERIFGDWYMQYKRTVPRWI